MRVCGCRFDPIHNWPLVYAPLVQKIMNLGAFGGHQKQKWRIHVKDVYMAVWLT